MFYYIIFFYNIVQLQQKYKVQSLILLMIFSRSFFYVLQEIIYIICIIYTSSIFFLCWTTINSTGGLFARRGVQGPFNIHLIIRIFATIKTQKKSHEFSSLIVHQSLHNSTWILTPISWISAITYTQYEFSITQVAHYPASHCRISMYSETTVHARCMYGSHRYNEGI